MSLPIKEEKLLPSLMLVDGLDVKGEGAAVEEALIKSAALDPLEAYYARNGSAAERSLFVAPSDKP